MSEKDLVLVDKSDGVGLVTLNRPDSLNALNGPIMARLADVIADVAEDGDIGCVVLTGAGRGFCPGGDLKEGGGKVEPASAALGTRTEQGHTRLLRQMEASRLLHEMPKPTIAMVNGPVAGAGIGLAGACDLRFASDTATFYPAFHRIGGGGDYGSSWFWTKILGTAKARELFFLSPKLSAEQALEWGIYNRVIPGDALRGAVMEIAKGLASGPRMGWRYMKQNLNNAEDTSFETALEREALNMTLSTQAAREIWKESQRDKSGT